MGKNNTTHHKSLKTIASGIGGTMIAYLMKFESLLALATMIDNPILTKFINIAVPVIFGVLCWGLAWLYFRVKEWIQQQLSRIEAIETELFDSEGNSRLDQIQNNQLIQYQINNLAGHGLNTIEKNELLDYLSDKNNAMQDSITNKNNDFGKDKAFQIVKTYQSLKDKKFHEPN